VATHGGFLELSLADVRFAHSAQSELFGRSSDKGSQQDGESLLLFVVELLSGKKGPEDVPIFEVCRHMGLWFCRSGNRRLAALRLASRYRPDGRFDRIRVRVVPPDHIFLYGIPSKNKRPKLTTHLNGEECQGRWMFVRETGESVGSGDGIGGLAEYGADLLSLLPVQASGAQRASDKSTGLV